MVPLRSIWHVAPQGISQGAAQALPQGPSYDDSSSSVYVPSRHSFQGASARSSIRGPSSYSSTPSRAAEGPPYAPPVGFPYSGGFGERFPPPISIQQQQQQYTQQQLLLEKPQQEQQEHAGTELALLQQQCKESLSTSIRIVGETTITSQATAEQLAAQSGQNVDPISQTVNCNLQNQFQKCGQRGGWGAAF